MHGRLIDEVGYHCRDYFLGQWERFRGYPGGILAHSTHLKGLGTYDTARAVETPRIRVTLATGIPRERCARINLGYQDPARLDPVRWAEEAGPADLVVPDAGEMLYRVGRPGAVSGPGLRADAAPECDRRPCRRPRCAARSR